jgi:hypothetical protein
VFGLICVCLDNPIVYFISGEAEMLAYLLGEVVAIDVVERNVNIVRLTTHDLNSEPGLLCRGPSHQPLSAWC